MKMLHIALLTTCITLHAQLCNPREVAIQYHEMGDFACDLETIVTNVMDRFSTPAVHAKQAVIFDVDDTALSNYTVLKALDFTFEFPTWEHCLRTQHLPAIAPIHRLYNHFKDRNYTIIFLTSRPERLRNVTIENLAQAEYHGYERLIMHPEKDTITHRASFKEHERTKLAQEGYEIICTLDDQDVYLRGEHVGYAVKIPNKFYSLAS